MLLESTKDEPLLGQPMHELMANSEQQTDAKRANKLQTIVTQAFYGFIIFSYCAGFDRRLIIGACVVAFTGFLIQWQRRGVSLTMLMSHLFERPPVILLLVVGFIYLATTLLQLKL